MFYNCFRWKCMEDLVTVVSYNLLNTLGDPVTYTHWDPSRKDPSLHGTEDCVGLGVEMAGYSGGAWEDLRCGMQLHYVCQFGIITCIVLHIMQLTALKLLDMES